ncbi:hypothetical protein P153DRAFT_324768 [Dothidotthia symphoricarpi CBS 119687]|uniref:Mmc1 C-terminal domain-containing protein n=1 Tax=Dothidotthia symphoricarpi CBS 119687 TaxID=1392245 RepID=A0A6A6A0V9_9PLEO|nr:uncharacterized protein P153DRAFT_324768 [Dothidotthia symphoricarpi CBS 119687]KAF2125450.1 hypothetical protein P153DRAFT_324768 [Dothidotthia symphoricarpi CBS 119687]
MPPWVASVSRSTTLLAGRVTERLPVALRCRHDGKPRFPNLRARSASTQVSPTAINLRPNIPSRNQELHDALSALSGAAETHVNISRLQLALRGLEAQDAVTRVAVLGLNSQVSAQRLARLLLADPLGAEEWWEKELDKPSSGDAGAVLLKFGEDSDAYPPSPLYKVLSVPSRTLRTHNLEVLVSTLNVNVANIVGSSSAESSKESVLVPKLQATATRGLPVPYPVHKTLLLGEGLDSAVAFGRFSSDSAEDLDDVVKMAIELPASLKEPNPDMETATSAINVELGTEALASFRESIQNSVAYERGWFRSGLAGLSKWFAHDIQTSDPIKPAMKTLISSIADDVEANILKEDTAQLQKLASPPTEISASIIGHLETWAEKSHTELRDQLDVAFSAQNWHKLSWWKLFWRVDDVTMLTSEILERRWLVSAEKNSIYLAGRMNQADYPEDLQGSVVNTVPETTTWETAPTIENPRTDLSTEVRNPQPWPEAISMTRTELIDTTIPPLQALAQRLVLATFSTTSISSALSALLYATSSFTLFEASAVAAVGLTFSLRHMQRTWEGARESWQGTVREEGRLQLKSTEDLVRTIVRHKENEMLGRGESESVKDRRAAREAVSKVREALKKMNDGL